jgi:hypothetical protein
MAFEQGPQVRGGTRSGQPGHDLHGRVGGFEQFSCEVTQGPHSHRCLTGKESLEPGAAQATQERCAGRAPGKHAGSARTPPEVPATAARAQRIRSIAVSGHSP